MLISIEQIIQQTFVLYKENWRRIAPYLGILALPSLATFLVKFGFSFLEKNAATTSLGILFMTIFSIISLGATMMFIRVVAKTIHNEKPDPVKEELFAGLRLIWPALLSSVLVGLAVLGGLILLIIPGIIFAIWFSFTAYSVALDEKKGAEALKESHNLVRGRWWAVFWRLVIPGLLFTFIAWVLRGIIELPIRWLYAATSSADYLLYFVAAIVSMLIALAILPLTTFAPALVYFSLKKNPGEKK